MDEELRQNLYKLLELLGRMEVENSRGVKTIWEWDLEAKKPKKCKIAHQKPQRPTILA
jgi:hypothetical protein